MFDKEQRKKSNRSSSSNNTENRIKMTSSLFALYVTMFYIQATLKYYSDKCSACINVYLCVFIFKYVFCCCCCRYDCCCCCASCGSKLLLSNSLCVYRIYTHFPLCLLRSVQTVCQRCDCIVQRPCDFLFKRILIHSRGVCARFDMKKKSHFYKQSRYTKRNTAKRKKTATHCQ